MTDTETTFDRVKKVIVNKLRVDESEVTEEADWVQLKADSLDLVEMFMGFQEEFAMGISDDDARELETVGQIVAYIERRRLEEETEEPKAA